MTGHHKVSTHLDTIPNPDIIIPLLVVALAARGDLLDPSHACAVRLFNGFYEGFPSLVVDLYGKTLVISNYADPPEGLSSSLPSIQEFYLSNLPWLSTLIIKSRNSQLLDERRGKIIYGSSPDKCVREQGVWYAIDLLFNQDTGFYIDTRNLRRWALNNLAGKSVLNTFAYTGSLGVAASAAGARRVIHLDRSKKYLDLARQSYALNGFPIHAENYWVGDFWEHIARLKHEAQLFDCVFIDPPFFATSKKGTVDLQAQSANLINKVRPLISHDGYLVAVNNALYLAGSEYIKSLEVLCESGYLSIEALIPVPQDITGYERTRRKLAPVDPVPFNHATKIAILRVQRKDGRKDP